MGNVSINDVKQAEKEGKLADTVEKHDAKVKMHDWLLVGIVVVVVVGFVATLVTAGAMINDSLAEKKAVSQSTRDQIKVQNDRIDSLTDRIEKLTEAIEDEEKTAPAPN